MTPTRHPSPLPTAVPTPRPPDPLSAPAGFPGPADGDVFARACAVLTEAGIGFAVLGETEVVDRAA